MGRWLFALLVASLFACGPASAQPFPNKPIRLIIGFAPGGPADVMARLVAQKIPQILGQPFIIENRDRKSTRLNSSHSQQSRMPSSA